METVNISIQLLNAIMANLGRQPYEQVFQLVEAIQKEAQSQSPKKESEEVK